MWVPRNLKVETDCIYTERGADVSEPPDVHYEFFSSFPIQVSVSMKFNGKSGVQVRTPPNLADLAAYTSMKLHIKLPDAVRTRRQDASNSQFVFYLGNKNVSVIGRHVARLSVLVGACLC